MNQCGEWLADPDGFVARCVEPFGVEHSHSDMTARAAVAARRAARSLPQPPSEPCEHGHYDCAHNEMGACHDENRGHCDACPR